MQSYQRSLCTAVIILQPGMVPLRVTCAAVEQLLWPSRTQDPIFTLLLSRPLMKIIWVKRYPFPSRCWLKIQMSLGFKRNIYKILLPFVMLTSLQKCERYMAAATDIQLHATKKYGVLTYSLIATIWRRSSACLLCNCYLHKYRNTDLLWIHVIAHM